MAAFSDRTLAHMSEALASCEQKNPDFSLSVSSDYLGARGELGAYGITGMDVSFQNGQYSCQYFRERSIDVETASDEEDAANQFIRYCKFHM